LFKPDTPIGDPFHQAILRAICYADIFNYPLTRKEIYQNVLRHELFANTANTNITNKKARKISEKDCDRVLEALVEQKLIIDSGFQGDKLFCLKGRGKIIRRREQSQTIQQKKMNLANKAAQTLAKIPTIQAVFITGSVAANNAKQQDDLDFMIVTKHNWLWTTRFFAVLLSKFLGVYRGADNDINCTKGKLRKQKQRDSWCLNIWLDEYALQIIPEKQNFYSAHEIVLAKPLIDAHNLHQKYLLENAWVREYLPNTSIPQKRMEIATSHIIPKEINLNLIEWFMYVVERYYMRRKRTREYVDRSAAFFHPRDMFPYVEKQFMKRMWAVGSKS